MPSTAVHLMSSSRAPSRCQVPFASGAFSYSCQMTPVTGGSASARAASGNAARHRMASALFTAFRELAQRDEFVAFRADAVDQPFQRLDADRRADERRMPEERRPGVAHHLVQARRFEHGVDMPRRAALI